MDTAYKELIQEVKKDYEIRLSTVQTKTGEEKRCPKWYDLGIDGEFTEELNLWNYWQGIGVDHPKLMLVGQDWGHVDTEDESFENIRAIAQDPATDTQYLSGISAFQTDNALIKIFDTHLKEKRDLRKRHSDLYFTNLCLGYRQDKSSGYWRQSWMTEDADKYFKRLVDIKRPEVIVCLGRGTAETAFRALTGEKLKMSKGFYDFIESDENGLPLPECGGARFYAMAHPGGMGAANRKSKRGGGKFVIDDWAFLAEYF